MGFLNWRAHFRQPCFKEDCSPESLPGMGMWGMGILLRYLGCRTDQDQRHIHTNCCMGNCANLLIKISSNTWNQLIFDVSAGLTQHIDGNDFTSTTPTSS